MEFLIERFAKLSGLDRSLPSEDVVEAAEERAPTLRELRALKKGKVLTESAKKESLVEQQVRSAIRSEIDQIIKEMQEKDELGWMFRGMDRPKNSSPGKITTGFPGLGFKSGNS
jgi:hypothetical protein